MSRDTRFTLAVLFVCACVAVIAHVFVGDRFAFVLREQITFGAQVLLALIMPALYLAILFVLGGLCALLIRKKI